MTIAAILAHKKRQIGDMPVADVTPTTSASDVARLLARRHIGAALVRDAAGQILGIVSERDIVRAIAQYGAAALERSAAMLMTSPVRTASLAMTVEQAMQTMSDGRFRHLPVMDDGKLVGLVSIGDVVTARLRQAAQEVDTLKAYVAGQA